MKKRQQRADVQERFGFAIRSCREALGFTQEDLAHQARIHRTYLSDIERGGRNVSLVNIEKLATALRLTLADLFRRVDESPDQR
jgi:transcriptional regulator with XRE-family HTH domain